MRGRLINPFLAAIARLDVAATAADPDGTGTLETGFNDVFGEVATYRDDDGKRQSARKEMPLIYLRCQIETQRVDDQVMLINGPSVSSRIGLVLSTPDLERLGLIDPTTGKVLLDNEDRLEGIYHPKTKALIRRFETPPGLYAVTASETSYAFGGPRNLFLMWFQERQASPPRGGGS